MLTIRRPMLATIFLSALLLCFAGGTWAESTGDLFTEGHFTYEVTGGGAVITGYSGEGPKEVVIPGQLGGYPVSGIKDSAFSRLGLVSVEIPDSVKVIGKKAFNWNKLVSVSLGSSLEEVGDSAFEVNRLTSITIPGGVKDIGMYAFAYNQITSIALGEGLESIGVNAFSDNQVETLELPPGLKDIGRKAFYGNRLASITIPDSVTRIGSSAFWGMDYRDITLGSGLGEYFLLEEGTLQGHIAAPAELVIPGDIGGERVTGIGEWAFGSCLLTSVTLPEGLTSIETRAFNDNRLSRVTVPDSVTHIGPLAFANNGLGYGDVELGAGFSGYFTYDPGDPGILTGDITGGDTGTLTVPPGVTGIGENSFQMVNLTTVTIPDSVEYIGNKAFIMTNLLESLTLGRGVVSIGDSAFAWNRLTSLELPQGLETIGDDAFAWNQLTSLTIPPGVTGIGPRAFANNRLSTVIIPPGAVQVGEDAFAFNQEDPADLVIFGVPGSPAQDYADAQGHTFKDMGSAAVNIPDARLEQALRDALGEEGEPGEEITRGDLESITVLSAPDRGIKDLAGLELAVNLVTLELRGNRVEDLAPLEGLAGLESLDVRYNFLDLGEGSPARELIQGLRGGGVEVRDDPQRDPAERPYTHTVTHGEAEITGYHREGPVEHLTIPGTLAGYPVTSIRDGKDWGDGVFTNAGLEGVELPGTLRYIGNLAFVSNRLTALEIPGGVTGIGARAFCCNGLESLVIPGSVESIGAAAFRGNQLTSLDIPEGVTSLGAAAFAGNRLPSVTIPHSVTSIGPGAFADNGLGEDQVTLGAGFDCFFVYSETDPGEVTGHILGGDQGAVNVPGGATSIGDRAFRFNGVTSVTLPDTLTRIGGEAFSYNQLTSVIIPDSVVSIGNWAFSENLIASLEVPPGVTSLGKGAFSVNRLTSVTLPEGLEEIEDQVFAHNLLTSVTIPQGVTRIGDWAFLENRLTSLEIPGTVTTIGGLAFLDNRLGPLTIPHSVTSIGPGAFAGNGLGEDQVTLGTGFTSYFLYSETDPGEVTGHILGGDQGVLNIPGGVTRIGPGAFANNQVLSLDLPDSLTSIGDFAFFNSLADNWHLPGNQLVSINFPASLTSIGALAFFNNRLSTVIIPPGAAQVGEDAFAFNQADPADLVIFGVPGSPAQDYAHENNHTFGELSDSVKTLTIRPAEGRGTTRPGAGDYYYAEGFQAPLAASPGEGWEFQKWVIGGAESAEAETNVIMDGDKTATAYFVETLDPGDCFIATAAFGSSLAPAVQLLRQFRDQVLLKSPAGQGLVDYYYRVSPPLAGHIAGSLTLRTLVQVTLLPLVAAAYLALHPGWLALIILAWGLWEQRKSSLAARYPGR